VFNSHARNRLGLPDARGTAVLLQFSSLKAVYYHMKQLHCIAADVGACQAKWQLEHDRRCQFDVVGIAVDDSLLDNECVSTCVCCCVCQWCEFCISIVVSGECLSSCTIVTMDVDVY